MPLPLTTKERKTLTTLLALILLGLIGMLILRDDPSASPPAKKKTDPAAAVRKNGE